MLPVNIYSLKLDALCVIKLFIIASHHDKVDRNDSLAEIVQEYFFI